MHSLLLLRFFIILLNFKNVYFIPYVNIHYLLSTGGELIPYHFLGNLHSMVEWAILYFTDEENVFAQTPQLVSVILVSRGTENTQQGTRNRTANPSSTAVSCVAVGLSLPGLSNRDGHLFLATSPSVFLDLIGAQ